VDEAEGGGDGVQALPVYVAAVDLACKSNPFAQYIPIMDSIPVHLMWEVTFICDNVNSGSYPKSPTRLKKKR
jgi:hypothetical protein